MKNLKEVVEDFQEYVKDNEHTDITSMSEKDLSHFLQDICPYFVELTDLEVIKEILLSSSSLEFMENLTNSPWEIDWDRSLTEEEAFMVESVGIEYLQLSVIRARARNNYNGTKEEIIDWFLDQVDCEEALPFVNKIISEEWAKIENKSYSLF